jgi:hypothetical protein
MGFGCPNRDSDALEPGIPFEGQRHASHAVGKQAGKDDSGTTSTRVSARTWVNLDQSPLRPTAASCRPRKRYNARRRGEGRYEALQTAVELDAIARACLPWRR